MAVLDSNLRRQLERTVVNARTAAESAADKALKRLGMHQHEPPSTLSADERLFRRELEAQKSQLANYHELVEQCAYEHWHRILFARFLAENDLLIHPTAGVAVNLEDCEDGELQREFGASEAYELAARFASQMLPAVFRPDDALLRVKLAPEDRLALEGLVKSLPEVVFKADDSLGWTYQFWQKEYKETVLEDERILRGGDVSAVTQLFTEHYMVRFLLENTLGAFWLSKRPQSELQTRWDYFKAEIPHDYSRFPNSLEEVTLLDPCCGSGHFLVDAFLLFQSMYREQGMNAAEAGDATIANNIRGLELDPRCTQIAAFNVAFAAWRHGGYRQLPEIQIACAGLPLKGSRAQWERLAQGDSVLTAGMALLHDTFSKADNLGSLIHPAGMFDVKAPDRARQFTLDEMPDSERQKQLDLATQIRWSAIEGLLTKALSSEASREEYHAGVRAQGAAKAAQMLSDRYWLVVTNPPFMAVAKGGDELMEFCNENHPEAKKDLATCFIERCAIFTHPGGECALVNPQNWLFLGRDRFLRQRLLKSFTWNALVRMGPKAFSTPMYDFNTALLVFSTLPPGDQSSFWAVDVSGERDYLSKANRIQNAGREPDTTPILLDQQVQLSNPDCKVVLESIRTDLPLLAEFADAPVGLMTGDTQRHLRNWWEQAIDGQRWRFCQSSGSSRVAVSGCDSAVEWLLADGSRPYVGYAVIVGSEAWGRRGTAVAIMSDLPTWEYFGDLFDKNIACVVAKQSEHSAAIRCYLESTEYKAAVRAIDQKIAVTNKTLMKVPFDLDHWQKVAVERYPDGLPDPHSDDPTQWLFRGDVPSSTDPLQVAVARLLGYRWPDQPEEPLDAHADDDGIVTLAPLVNQGGITGRLRALLQAAYQSEAPARPKGAPEPKEPRVWDENVIPNLLVRAGSSGMSLEEWLRDKFFDSHTKLFQQRPFIWHIWDGRKDGFHAFVNYHKLDRKNLERLTHVYLGEWIERQRAASESGDRTADARLIAAQELQRKLELIRTGEPPYDIFVRWKNLAEQPMGWDPDLNDGVRMNIRPFVEAGILRGRVNVNWNKDRGKDPKPNVSGTVERHNDLHFTLAQKRAAREAGGRSG